MRARLFVGLVVVASAASMACLDDSITGIRPLTLEFTVEPESAGLNELITAQYAATGTGLIGVIVNWGDGVVDSLQLPGALVSASGPMEHQYTVAGTYDVTGTVEAQNGVISKQATVEIN